MFKVKTHGHGIHFRDRSSCLRCQHQRPRTGHHLFQAAASACHKGFLMQDRFCRLRRQKLLQGGSLLFLGFQIRIIIQIQKVHRAIAVQIAESLLRSAVNGIYNPGGILIIQLPVPVYVSIGQNPRLRTFVCQSRLSGVKLYPVSQLRHCNMLRVIHITCAGYRQIIFSFCHSRKPHRSSRSRRLLLCPPGKRQFTGIRLRTA